MPILLRSLSLGARALPRAVRVSLAGLVTGLVAGASIVASTTALTACDGSPPEQSGTTEPITSDPVPTVTTDALFVINGGDASMSVVDTEADEVRGVVRFHGIVFPHHIYMSPDRARLAVAVPGFDMSGGHAGHAGSGPPGAVLLLDATTGAMITNVRTPISNHNALYAPGGKEIWTALLDGHVLALDPNTLQTISETNIGTGSGPSEVTFGADGLHAFVADTGTGTVSVMATDTKAIVKTLPVGQAPVGAWQAPTGFAYVDNENDGTLSVIDTRSINVVKTYVLGFVPGVPTPGPDGNVWIADPNNSQVVVHAPDSDTVVAKIPAGNGTHMVVFSADQKKAYVCNQTAGTLTVIDVATRTPIKTLTVGSKPNGMVFRSKK